MRLFYINQRGWFSEDLMRGFGDESAMFIRFHDVPSFVITDGPRVIFAFKKPEDEMESHGYPNLMLTNPLERGRGTWPIQPWESL